MPSRNRVGGCWKGKKTIVWLSGSVGWSLHLADGMLLTWVGKRLARIPPQMHSQMHLEQPINRSDCRAIVFAPQAHLAAMSLDAIGRPCPEVTNMYIRVHNLTQSTVIIHSRVCSMLQSPEIVHSCTKSQIVRCPFQVVLASSGTVVVERGIAWHWSVCSALCDHPVQLPPSAP